MAAKNHLNPFQLDPINPYLTDSVTKWDKDRKAFVTIVYGLNEKNQRIVKYQVTHSSSSD
jgi:hypothetical protein